MAAAAVLAGPRSAAAEPPRVVVSVKPLHGLVAGVMRGVAKPVLLIDGAPPTVEQGLTEAQVKMLSDTDIVFWIGPRLEKAIEKPLRSIGKTVKNVKLLAVSGVRLMSLPKVPKAQNPVKAGDTPDADGAAKTGVPNAPDGALKSDPAAGDRTPNDGTTPEPVARPRRKRVLRKADVSPRRPDPHIWLDPRNAVAVVRAVARTLVATDPENAGRYRRNAAYMIVQIETLDAQMSGMLLGLRGRAYATVNRRFQYFERQYVLSRAVDVRLDPAGEDAPKRAAKLSASVRGGRARCLFYAAGLDPKLARAIGRRTRARLAPVDLYGAKLTAGPEAYMELMQDVAGAFAGCLDPSRRR